MIRRSGNFGFVDDGAGRIYSFSMAAGTAGAAERGWEPSALSVQGGRATFAWNYISGPGGERIIPYGADNDLPGYVKRVLGKFYAGEGILGKKAGLQWGNGPRLYMDDVDDANRYYRRWVLAEGKDVLDALKEADWQRHMHRCLIDLCHLEGFWVKITCSRGRRIGRGKIARVEYMPASRVRFVYPGDGIIEPREAMVADWPRWDSRFCWKYPLFDPRDPFRHAVSLAYCNIYSFGESHYSIPRFAGAFDWIELVGTLANVLAAYNQNASAISMHIESPASYWEQAEERLKDKCMTSGVEYTPEMLERFKDEAMEYFARNMSGGENAGKFMHTSQYFNPEANSFEGWKVVPIDKKIKDFIEAQVKICDKAETASTTGFGLDPALANLVMNGSLSSGSEKLYSFKVFNATETAVPDMVLCQPWQWMVDANFPGRGLRVGLYRAIVESEQNVSPKNRMKENV